jgi:acyl carrier protein
MLYDEIIQEVREYIQTNILIGVTNGHLDAHDSFLQRGILNSTGVLELVGFLEERYRFRCSDEEITPENLDSLQRIAEFVGSKINSGTSS